MHWRICIRGGLTQKGLIYADGDDEWFFLEDDSETNSGRHTMPSSPRGVPCGPSPFVADDPELARLGGTPPAERVFLYLQVVVFSALNFD